MFAHAHALTLHFTPMIYKRQSFRHLVLVNLFPRERRFFKREQPTTYYPVEFRGNVRLALASINTIITCCNRRAYDHRFLTYEILMFACRQRQGQLRKIWVSAHGRLPQSESRQRRCRSHPHCACVVTRIHTPVHTETRISCQQYQTTRYIMSRHSVAKGSSTNGTACQ